MNTLSVDTGAGNDTAALAHGAGVLSADIRTGAGNDAVQLSASAGAARSYTDSWDTDHEGSLAVDLGGGDDILTVDAALAGGFAALPANAGEGYDTLILVGTLNEDESDPVSGTLTKTEDGTYTGKIRLMADGCDEEFLVTLAGGYGCLTDTLENKPTVELTKEVAKQEAEKEPRHVTIPELVAMVAGELDMKPDCIFAAIVTAFDLIGDLDLIVDAEDEDDDEE